MPGHNKTLRAELSLCFPLNQDQTMKKHFVKLLVVLWLPAAFAGCEKETGKTKTEYLTALSWRLENAGIDSNRDGIVDIADTSLQDCAKDGTLGFFTKGTGLLDEGPTRCSPDDPQSRTFSWAFLNNEMQLEFDGKVYSVYSVGPEKLKIYYEFDAGGDNYLRYLLVLKH